MMRPRREVRTKSKSMQLQKKKKRSIHHLQSEEANYCHAHCHRKVSNVYFDIATMHRVNLVSNDSKLFWSFAQNTLFYSHIRIKFEMDFMKNEINKMDNFLLKSRSKEKLEV